MGKVFIVYIMASRKNGTLYVGVSGDPEGRIIEHGRSGLSKRVTRIGAISIVR
jgi:predicted GIY-YIG superfamily endonuclease